MTEMNFEISDPSCYDPRPKQNSFVPGGPRHDKRWKGNVMAALERKFSEEIVDELAVTIDARPIRLTRE